MKNVSLILIYIRFTELKVENKNRIYICLFHIYTNEISVHLNQKATGDTYPAREGDTSRWHPKGNKVHTSLSQFTTDYLIDHVTK